MRSTEAPEPHTARTESAGHRGEAHAVWARDLACPADSWRLESFTSVAFWNARRNTGTYSCLSPQCANFVTAPRVKDADAEKGSLLPQDAVEKPVEKKKKGGESEDKKAKKALQ